MSNLTTEFSKSLYILPIVFLLESVIIIIVKRNSKEFPIGSSKKVKKLTITDDITDSEQNISFDVSSVIAGNIAYFLVNVDSVHTHVTDKENMVQDYFFNYVSDDSLPCDGYVHDINDCKKFFDAIIKACGLETHILEE